MKNTKTHLSGEFKRLATKAILSIISFITIYLLLLLLAFTITVLCIIGAYFLISKVPSFLTLVLGLGLASLGILILIFLIKFIFKSHKEYNSLLIEMYPEEEPELFKMIREIADEVGTGYPQRVYLSQDVNASVFYNSNFWSMFLPVKKNLQIGLGLVNAVSKEELKAVLSHEFGHFSQRTLKVGSYVYNVNRIIFNTLYEDDAYDNLVRKWGSVNGVFSSFIAIAAKINEGIKWVLRYQYAVVNKSYLGLLREMEFQADEIAANITGSDHLKTSLLRLSLADSSMNSTLSFYDRKIAENLVSENIYRDQSAVMKFLAERNNFPIVHGLPNISLVEQSKFDKSKLKIKDQWASHPSTKERIERLDKLNITSKNSSYVLANTIFNKIEDLQESLTGKMFEAVTYSGETRYISLEEFQTEFHNEYQKNTFSKIYNNYYDDKNFDYFEIKNVPAEELHLDFSELFSDEKVDLVYAHVALRNDLETIRQIADNSYKIKTFDYDGTRYSRKDIAELSLKLENELQESGKLIACNDINIFEYFRKLELQQNNESRLENHYKEFFEFDSIFDSKYEIYLQLSNGLQFVSVTTPFDQIRACLSQIKPLEEKLKVELKDILSDNLLSPGIPPDSRNILEQYISKEQVYFNGTHYIDENLKTLYSALNQYAELISMKYFILKKRILDYQEELFKNQT